MINVHFIRQLHEIRTTKRASNLQISTEQKIVGSNLTGVEVFWDLKYCSAVHCM
jgi:hypothetical protein